LLFSKIFLFLKQNIFILHTSSIHFINPNSLQPLHLAASTAFWHEPCRQNRIGFFTHFFYYFHKEQRLMAKTKTKINIKPLADRVLVKRLDEEEEQKVGGIIIPDTAKEKPQEAEIVAVGPGKIEDGKRIELEVKTGDKVLIGKYSGTEVKIEGEEYLIMREDDILAIVE